MSSEKQIEANRLNAQKSTGPKTPEGKEAASMNHLKHGLRARTVVLTALGESQADFDELSMALQHQWEPRTATELLYLEEMAISHWRLARAERMQDQLLVLAGKDGLAVGPTVPSSSSFPSSRRASSSPSPAPSANWSDCQTRPLEEESDEAEDAETETETGGSAAFRPAPRD